MNFSKDWSNAGKGGFQSSGGAKIEKKKGFKYIHNHEKIGSKQSVNEQNVNELYPKGNACNQKLNDLELSIKVKLTNTYREDKFRIVSFWIRKQMSDL